MITNERAVAELNYYVRTYDGVTKLIAATKQRLQTLPGIEIDEDFDAVLKGEGKAEGLFTVKGRFSRLIEKHLLLWPLWTMWLQHVPGIGPAIGGKLILLYYYRFKPACKQCGGPMDKHGVPGDDGTEINTFVCQACGATARGEGSLIFRMEPREFSTISKWWAYMGRHTVDGAVPRRKKGMICAWSTEGRVTGFQIGEQFNRHGDDEPYKRFLLERKARYARRHPDWKKGHVHNAARNDAIKLFLSHFWTVARSIDGLPVSQPYAGALMGHTNIIEPYYWQPEPAQVKEKEKAKRGRPGKRQAEGIGQRA